MTRVLVLAFQSSIFQGDEMLEDEKTAVVPLQVAAWECGRKGLKGLVILFAVVFGCGWALENPEAVASIWAGALWTASLGGVYWGAMFVGTVAGFVAGWALCLHCKTDEFSLFALVKTWAACWVVWFVAYRAGWGLSPAEWQDFSGYMQVGMVVLSGIGFLWTVMIVGMLLEGAKTALGLSEPLEN